MATELLRSAKRRADSLRDRYRSAGFWSPDPLDVVRFVAARYPTRPALITRDAELTYAELDERVDTAACAMLEAGVAASTPLVVVVGNDIDSVVAVHAALRVDAVVLLVPRSAGATQIADIVTRAGAKLGIAPNLGPETESALRGCCSWVEVGPGSDAAVPGRPIRPADEPSVIIYTSGTTSRPKGVVHSLSTLTKASANYIAAAGLRSDDRIMLVSPLGSVTGVLQALLIGPMLTGSVVLEDQWNPADTCDLLRSAGATWYGGPDRLLDRLLDEAAVRGEVPLRAVYLGGTTLDRRIVERAEADFGIVVMRAYGSSEVPVSTSGLRREPKAVRHADDGVALADVEVRVGSVGHPEECCIKGPHTFLGYTDTDDDEAAFDGEWFRTGDIAELADRRVRIVGRIKDIIIRNGLKIPAAEVEEAVQGIAGVKDCAAYPVPDPTTGEHLAIALLVDAGVDLSLASVTDALVSAGLAKYKLPEEVVFWDHALPLNANGKVARKTLHGLSEGRPRLFASRLC